MENTEPTSTKRRRADSPVSAESRLKRIHTLPTPSSSSLSLPNSQKGSFSALRTAQKVSTKLSEDEELFGPALPEDMTDMAARISPSNRLIFPKPEQKPFEFSVTGPEVIEFISSNGSSHSAVNEAEETTSTPKPRRSLPSPPDSPMTPDGILDAIREARKALKREAAEDGEELSDDSGEDSDVSRLSMHLQPLSLGEPAIDHVGCELDETDGAMSLDEASDICESEGGHCVNMTEKNGIDHEDADDELQKALEAALDEIEDEGGYAADLED